MSLKFQVVRYNFTDHKIKKPLRIVMIADLHNQVYGTANAELLSAVSGERPDLILLPGDMIVCRKSEREQAYATAAFIGKMTGIAPVYYAYGNHERGLVEGVRETEGIWEAYERQLAGVKNLHMLVNECAVLEPWNARVCGLDLSRAYYKRIIKKPLQKAALTAMIKPLSTEYYNILMAHNPDYFRSYCKLNPDLILAGHNHGGMIRIPGIGGVVSPRLHPFPKYDYGVYEDKETEAKMVVTAGCGMHSIHVRINNPPEIVVIDVNKV